MDRAPAAQRTAYTTASADDTELVLAGSFEGEPCYLLPTALFGIVSFRAVLLWGVLWEHSASGTRPCLPSRATLAEELRCGVGSITKASQELIAAGWLFVQHRGPGRTNRYELIACSGEVVP